MKVLVLFSLGLLLVPPCQGGSAGFESTGNMTAARQGFTATLLPDGKVLAIGGLDNYDYLSSAELFDPASGTWTAIGNLNDGRFKHTATLLPDGRVLLAGGGVNYFPSDTAELFDPSTGISTTTGSLVGPRYSHTATLLPNGKVLVVAGRYNDFYYGFPLDTVELYDPASGTWSTTRRLAKAREGHTATLLPNGKVLVAGGDDFETSNGEGFVAVAELYDPASGIWSATGSLSIPRSWHTATLLPSGKVIVAGGLGSDGFLSSAEIYDPENEKWTAAGELNVPRAFHTDALLANGDVLVVGGENADFLASAEFYDPEKDAWTTTGSLETARRFQTETLLSDGSVLVAGGNHSSTDNGALDSAELYVRSGDLLNISTRLDVGTGDDVMIGGFIITGAEPETVVVRGIGPSLAVPGVLADPNIELHDGSGALLAENDNWKDDPNQQQVIDDGLAPTQEAESALWQTLDPGAYTVILRGKDEGTGVGLIEIYEVDQGSVTGLANISTRGLVQTDDNVLIGGLIVGGGTGDGSANVVIRALGPSLPVANALSNPTLELHDGSGTLLDSNHDWKTRPDGSSQQAEIEATLLAPNDDLEAALVETLAPGSYTAVLRGHDNAVGVGIVEVYNLP